jgi:hypothetical protein
MSRGGSVGTTVTLEARFYQAGSLYDPFSVDDVDIYDLFSGGTAVATALSPTNPSVGVYQVEWDIPAGQTPAFYYDEWKWAPANGDPVESVRFTLEATPLTTAVTLVVEDDQATPEPIESVLCRVYSAAGAFITQGYSDVDGEFDLYLPGAPDPGTEYLIHLYKPGVSFESPTQKIYVFDPVVPPATNTFDFTGHVATLPESSDPYLCKLSGYLADASLNGIPKAIILFRLVPGLEYTYPEGLMPPGAPVAGRKVAIYEVRAEADEDGYIEVQLQRGASYYAHVYGLEHPTLISEKIRVPDSAGAALEDVLFPYVFDVSFSETSVALLTNFSVDLNVSALSSDGHYLEDPFSYLDFESSDGGVATVSVNGGMLTITAVAPGSATISAARWDGTYAPRMDVLPAFTETIDVTVT